ncbi:MAG: helix-turn-helix transcriptional regulator [Planctomycetes bacterium]|nr:helix-turn-helix transcriptional regulator [Planctomycetota bacterium]
MRVEADRRTPARRARDEAIARDVEADRPRILRMIQAASRRGARGLELRGGKLARDLMASLVRARRSRRLTQKQVALSLGMPQSVIGRFESGTHSPTLGTLTRYAAAIGATLVVRIPA